MSKWFALGFHPPIQPKWQWNKSFSFHSSWCCYERLECSIATVRLVEVYTVNKLQLLSPPWNRQAPHFTCACHGLASQPRGVVTWSPVTLSLQLQSQRIRRHFVKETRGISRTKKTCNLSGYWNYPAFFGFYIHQLNSLRELQLFKKNTTLA